MPEADPTGHQLELIARLAALEPPMFLMGGYAEDALLAGRVTRPHEDVDVIFPRYEEALRMDQLAELGFTEWETWGEAAPGVPFYLCGQSGDLRVDVGLLDREGTRQLDACASAGVHGRRRAGAGRVPAAAVG